MTIQYNELDAKERRKFLQTGFLPSFLLLEVIFLSIRTTVLLYIDVVLSFTTIYAHRGSFWCLWFVVLISLCNILYVLYFQHKIAFLVVVS